MPTKDEKTRVPEVPEEDTTDVDISDDTTDDDEDDDIEDDGTEDLDEPQDSSS